MLKIIPLCLILFLPVAYAELYNPTVCTIPPNDPLISDSIKKQYLKETRDSVMEWQYKIQSVAKIPKNWKINYVEDGTNCDVIISFKRAYEDTTLSFHADVLGMYENGKIELYFQEYSTCGSRGETRCYYDDVIPARELGMVARHEFGHAIGLSHYEDDYGYDFEGIGISIMTPYTDRSKIKVIQNIDAEHVIRMYGQEGFTKKLPQFQLETPQKIPDWIKNNAKWWSENKITDEEYLEAIRYLINQKIIIL